MKIFKKSVSVITLLCAIGIVVSGCSGGGGGGGSAAGAGTIKLTGTVDSTMTMAAKPSLFNRVLAFFSPVKKAFAGGTMINNVVAISSDGTFASASLTGNTFSLDLVKGKPYIIVLLNGTTIVGVYKADATTGMNSFPISINSTDIDLGTVTLIGNIAQGTISSSSLLQDLGLTQSIANAYGIMDVAMTRLSNVDVDGNGVIDYQEGKSYSFAIDYEFNGTDSFASIQGNWSKYADISYKGYEYYFWAYPDTLSSATWAGATLHTPNSVNGLNDQIPCWNVADPTSGRNLNFFCGGSATSPATPPAGTYTVTAGATVFTFQNVNSQTIDSNLYNIYMPRIKLTMDSNGKITQIDWQWWKNQSGTWVQPSDAELSTVLSNAQYEISDAAWSASNRVRGSISLTTTGTTAVPSQSFTPGAFRISYTDQAAYHYGFEWH